MTTTTKKTRKKKETKAEKLLREEWETVAGKSSGEGEDYKITKAFQPGDEINHPKFGLGFVKKKIEQNKIQVLFLNGLVILAHNFSGA